MLLFLVLSMVCFGNDYFVLKNTNYSDQKDIKETKYIDFLQIIAYNKIKWRK